VSPTDVFEQSEIPAAGVVVTAAVTKAATRRPSTRPAKRPEPGRLARVRATRDIHGMLPAADAFRPAPVDTGMSHGAVCCRRTANAKPPARAGLARIGTL
jgi:hypothetical protein